MISSYLQLDKAKHGERIKALYDDYNRFLIEGNEMTKLVLGAGFNDKTRPAFVDGKIVKEHQLWHNMLSRCFSEKYQTRKPTYKGCNVSDNFLSYAFFYDWCQEQIGFGKVDEKGRSWCLDKDLLFIDNKTYSETTCVFVPNEINSFFTDRGNDRGEYPVGVSFHKRAGKFKAQCNVNGKIQHLGLFNTPEEAFAVYKPFKEALCKQLALKWESEIDTRLFNAMMKWSV